MAKIPFTRYHFLQVGQAVGGLHFKNKLADGWRIQGRRKAAYRVGDVVDLVITGWSWRDQWVRLVLVGAGVWYVIDVSGVRESFHELNPSAQSAVQSRFRALVDELGGSDRVGAYQSYLELPKQC